MSEILSTILAVMILQFMGPSLHECAILAEKVSNDHGVTTGPSLSNPETLSFDSLKVKLGECSGVG